MNVNLCKRLLIITCVMTLISLIIIMHVSTKTSRLALKQPHRRLAFQTGLSSHPLSEAMRVTSGVRPIPVVNTTKELTNNKKLLTQEELKQIKRSYYDAPIVVEKYKLIFFWNEKAGCSTWKQILRFLSGVNISGDASLVKVHSPWANGLKYLCDYSDKEITAMILNNTWFKVAFVREPRERILSAYLEKVVKTKAFVKLCQEKSKSFRVFLRVIKTCKDDHWESQVRAPIWLYRQMLIGTMSNFKNFTVDLMKKIGAWNSDTQKVLTTVRFSPHATNSSSKLFTYYNDTRLQDAIFEMYKDDYEVFGFKKSYFQW